MPDTGLPWEIPYAAPADLVRDWPALSEDVADAVAAGLSAVGAGAVEVITATNATWPVPSLSSPIVKVTAIGGGGGGPNAGNVVAPDTGAGGTTTFNAAGAGTVTAAGGALTPAASSTPSAPSAFASNNGGRSARAAANLSTNNIAAGGDGFGGEIVIEYLDLSGISTVNVTIGAGGLGATGGVNGGNGGPGLVIVEYKAA